MSFFFFFFKFDSPSSIRLQRPVSLVEKLFIKTQRIGQQSVKQYGSPKEKELKPMESVIMEYIASYKDSAIINDLSFSNQLGTTFL